MENQVPDKFYYELGEYKYNTNGKSRTLSGIRELDYLTKGFENGCITLWTGLTNSGKTTMLTMITNATVNQGEKVFIFNGEQTKDEFKNNLYKQNVDKKDIYSVQYKESCVFDYYVKNDRVTELNRKYGNMIFIYNNEMDRDIDTLLYAMEDCRRVYGVKVFVLDNFMQIDITKDDVFTEQSRIMEKLRTFAVNKNVHIHLVAHPKKIERFTTRLCLYDIAGSMNMANKAYNVISIMRVDNLDKESNEFKKLSKEMLNQGYDINETSSILEVLKTKGNGCGLVGLIYDRDTGKFTEQPKMTSEKAEKIKRQSKNPFKGGSDEF